MATLSSPTFGNLIDEVLTNLHGMTSDLEELTWLTQAIGTSDTTFGVGNASNVSQGIIEIDSELMWVDSTDQTNNTVTLAPFGRGFRETSTTAHIQNAMVMNNPRFPRKHAAEAIQETLYAVYPDLFQVKTDETNTVIPVVITYPLPADCDTIIEIRWQNIGPSRLWVPVRSWKYDPRADTTVFTSGKSVDIYDGMIPGKPIKITYISQPGQLINESDVFSTTGLQDTTRDVIVFGACYRLLANLEVSRLQTFSVEQSERSLLVPPGSATQSSKYFFGLYQQALQREMLRLQKFYPSRTHLVR